MTASKLSTSTTTSRAPGSPNSRMGSPAWMTPSLLRATPSTEPLTGDRTGTLSTLPLPVSRAADTSRRVLAAASSWAITSSSKRADRRIAWARSAAARACCNRSSETKCSSLRACNRDSSRIARSASASAAATFWRVEFRAERADCTFASASARLLASRVLAGIGSTSVRSSPGITVSPTSRDTRCR